MDPSTFKAIVARWMRGGGDGYNPLDVLSSATAVTVLGELSVGGSLMRGPTPNSAIRKLNYNTLNNRDSNNLYFTDLSSDLQKELKQLYASLSEILRHFWAAFPPSTPQLVEKANRMVDALHRFSQVIS